MSKLKSTLMLGAIAAMESASIEANFEYVARESFYPKYSLRGGSGYPSPPKSRVFWGSQRKRRKAIRNNPSLLKSKKYKSSK